jgi:transposase
MPFPRVLLSTGDCICCSIVNPPFVMVSPTTALGSRVGLGEPDTTEDVSVAAFTGAAKTIDAIAVSGIVNLRENVMLLIAFSRLVRYNSYLLLFPNILIMKPHSIAFRQKIIEVHEVEDISQRKLAKRFNVALSFIQKLLKQYRETDSLAPKVRTQQTPAKLNDEHLTVLRRLVEERNDATLEELRKQLIHETVIDVSRSTVDRALDKLGLTLKKRRSMLTRRKLSESSLSV